MSDFLFARSQMAMSLALVIALGFGAILLLPSLAYLFYVFKRSEPG